MDFLGTEGEMIARNQANQLMDNYRNSPAFLANNATEGILFGRDHLLSILQQPGCKGIRIYFGKVDSLSSSSPQLIIVGTDESGNDLVNLILDAGLPCPSFCAPTTKL